MGRRGFLTLTGALTLTPIAIPIYYGTFPVLRGTPQEYQAALGQAATQVYPINPGDKLEF
jgi:hypothetical protein